MGTPTHIQGLLVVLSTAPSREVAESLAESLLDRKLCACVNIVPGVLSRYLWKGEKEKTEECLLLIKCPEKNWNLLKTAIEELHPYEIPECIALSPQDILPAYLRWALEETDSEEAPKATHSGPNFGQS